jgi:hypothetical protein
MVYPVPVHSRVSGLWPALPPSAREAEAAIIPVDLVHEDLSEDLFSALSDSQGEERAPAWSTMGEGLVMNGVREDFSRYGTPISTRLESYLLTEPQLGKNVDIYV